MRAGGVAAGDDFLAVGGEKPVQGLEAKQGGALGDLVGADRNGVEIFFNLGDHRLPCQKCANAVPGEAVGFRERVEMDRHIGPIRAVKQAMGCLLGAIIVAVGLVDDQRKPRIPRQIGKLRDQRRGVFCPSWVVGADQNNGAGAGVDQSRGRLGAGAHIRADLQHAGFDPRHVEVHFVIEIPRRGQDDIVTGRGNRIDGGAKGLVAAGGYGDLVSIEACGIILRPFLRDGVAQIRKAQNRPI